MPLSSPRSHPRGGGACPTCGAPTADDQLVCLECGSRVALDYRRPPSWRVPVAIIAAVVLLIAVASAIALNRIGDDAEREIGRTPIKSGSGKKDDARERPAEPALVKQGALYTWPPDLDGFTVVLQRTEDRPSAEEFARSASEGAPAKIGVLRTDDFTNLEGGFFVVFAGRYESRRLAEAAAERLDERFAGAVPQAIER